MNICADDYGLDYQVNEAIIRLVDLNKVTSVSVLINRCNSYDIQKLKKYPRLHIGLHLDIFKEAPLENYFKYVLSLAKLRSEISEQIKRFHFKFGFFPQYIDGHMHCHIYPSISNSLIEVLKKSDLPNNFYVRSCNVPKNLRKGTVTIKLYLSLLNYLNQKFIQKLKIENIKSNNQLYGAFNNHLSIQEVFKSFQKNANRDDIFFFHPSLENLKIDSSRNALNRKEEYEYFAQI